MFNVPAFDCNHHKRSGMGFPLEGHIATQKVLDFGISDFRFLDYNANPPNFFFLTEKDLSSVI
jgi:hypothetical protein